MITKKDDTYVTEALDEAKNPRPKMAICYDFDKTLSPDDMQTFTLIPSFGIDKNAFWEESDRLAKDHLMDTNLAWMYELIKYSEFKEKSLKREYFKKTGADVKLYPGVKTWFSKINAYADAEGIDVEHYIISSGLKEIIEGSEIAPYFKRIYASSYLYSTDGVAKWPAQAINYTNKTQFLFRIAKGCLEEYDEKVNDSVPEQKLRIPYENMVYIGDSSTDIPCMQLIKNKGGHSIGVYDPESNDKTKVSNLLLDGRLNYFAPAEYTEDGALFRFLTKVIDSVKTREKIKAEQAVLKDPLEVIKLKKKIESFTDTCPDSISNVEKREFNKIKNSLDKIVPEQE